MKTEKIVAGIYGLLGMVYQKNLKELKKFVQVQKREMWKF